MWTWLYVAAILCSIVYLTLKVKNTWKFASLWNDLQQITLQVKSRCAVVFFKLPLTDSLTTSSDHSSESSVSATEVLLFCAPSKSVPVFILAAFESDIVDCSFLLFFFLFCFHLSFVFSWCRRKIVNAQSGSLVWQGSCLKSVENKTPIVDGRAWWKVWKETSLCDGLAVVIVMMHLLIFIFPLHWRNWETLCH